MNCPLAIGRAQILSLFACLLLPGAAQAAAPLSDVAAINKALENAKPGDTILIKNGVYADARIAIPTSGEKDKPIILAAETPGKVTFTGRSRIVLGGKSLHLTGMVFHKNIGGTAVEFKAAQHCRLSHTAFNESGDTKSVFAHMVEVGEGSADNRIDHCYLAKSLSMSIGTRTGALRIQIDHNWFQDIVSRSSNGQEAVQLLAFNEIDAPEHSLFATVEYNLFDGACGDEEILSVKSSGNLIRYNTFLGHPTHNKGGLNVRHGHNNRIDSNTFLRTDYGVRVSGSGNVVINNYIEGVRVGLRLAAGGTNGWAYLPCKDGVFANNTIVNAATGMDVALFFGMKDTKTGSSNLVNIYPSGNRIYNNILTAADPNQLVCDRAESLAAELNVKRDATANDYRNNIVFLTKDASEPIRMPEGFGGFTVADPKLGKGDGREKPQAGSPALGGGISVEQVKEDIRGRPRGAKPDIGCEEVSSIAAPKPHTLPLTAKDVGPDWMKGDSTCLEKDAGAEELKTLIRRYPSAEYRQRLRKVLDEAGQ
ncbi:MAG TPA: hypothetical protein DCX07_14775 [Phycisphaerales bacterium]|nr:hypothetical protein [Phycisphaerales bacterium]